MGLHQTYTLEKVRSPWTGKLVVGICAVAVLIALSWLRGCWIPNRPDPAKYPVRGIGVSQQNGEIDWQRVKRRGVDFAYIRATEGAGGVDQRLARNWRGARENDIVPGAIHIFSAASSGEAQALNFIQHVPAEKNTLPPAIGLGFTRAVPEMTPDQFWRELNSIRDILRNRYGADPVLCTAEQFAGVAPGDRDIERLWVREPISRPAGWAREWLFWQYSNRGRVPGVNGRVDLNVFRQSPDAFKRLLTR